MTDAMPVIDKTRSASESAWGPLGNPSKEQIQKWCELPAGEFERIYKEAKKKKRKNKVYTEYTVYVTKKVYDEYLCAVKVTDWEPNAAVNQVSSMHKENFIFEEVPFTSKKETYTYSTWKPNK